MNVSVGKHFEKFCAALVKGGRYQNTSEVVRAGLRHIEDEELSPEADLPGLIQEGLDSGPAEPASDAYFARMKTEHAAWLKKQKRK